MQSCPKELYMVSYQTDKDGLYSSFSEETIWQAARANRLQRRQYSVRVGTPDVSFKTVAKKQAGLIYEPSQRKTKLNINRRANWSKLW